MTRGVEHPHRAAEQRHGFLRELSKGGVEIEPPALLTGIYNEAVAEQGLPAAWLEHARSAQVQQAYESHTAAAIAAGVFGAPSYVIDGEIFWGQDRLDFVERALAR